MAQSTMRNPALAPEGQLKIDWVREHMPILNEIRKEFEAAKPFAGLRMAVCCHLEAKTAYLAMVLAAGGGDVTLTGSNPLSTQDDVVAAVAQNGVTVHSWHGATPEEFKRFLHLTLDSRPQLIMDDGGDLVSLIHTERRDLIPDVIGGSEETTTGIIRLKAMEAQGVLEFPMMAVNNAYCKHLFDNRYGTGQSTWDGIMRNTNLVVNGKTVVVAGYGWCGKGVALRARGLGARVIVTEIDPIPANEAIMEGYEVMPMAEAARLGDIFVTVTGCNDVIREEHFRVMKDGAILANAGHFDAEISKPDLHKLAISRRIVRKNIEEFALADGRRLYLLAEGRLVNIAAADGHPAEIMDLSFAVQALALKHVLEHRGSLPKAVIPVGRELDHRVASLRLKALGVAVDRLTPEQEQYLRSWQV